MDFYRKTKKQIVAFTALAHTLQHNHMWKEYQTIYGCQNTKRSVSSKCMLYGNTLVSFWITNCNIFDVRVCDFITFCMILASTLALTAGGLPLLVEHKNVVKFLVFSTNSSFLNTIEECRHQVKHTLIVFEYYEIFEDMKYSILVYFRTAWFKFSIMDFIMKKDADCSYFWSIVYNSYFWHLANIATYITFIYYSSSSKSFPYSRKWYTISIVSRHFVMSPSLLICMSLIR